MEGEISMCAMRELRISTEEVDLLLKSLNPESSKNSESIRKAKFDDHKKDFGVLAVFHLQIMVSRDGQR